MTMLGFMNGLVSMCSIGRIGNSGERHFYLELCCELSPLFGGHAAGPMPRNSR